MRCPPGALLQWAAFASVGAGGLSRLAVWWIRLGIQPERIAPGHPEQNVEHERMYGTTIVVGGSGIAAPPGETRYR